jgi:hypothetical protein
MALASADVTRKRATLKVVTKTHASVYIDKFCASISDFHDANEPLTAGAQARDFLSGIVSQIAVKVDRSYEPILTTGSYETNFWDDSFRGAGA